jgi:glycosyltransferase involved in cell wall biosynthesis
MPDATDDDTRQWLPGASNKPFDYLASGLALLVSNLPGWRDLLVEPGYGATCDAQDPHSIAEALRWFIDHPTEMRAMGERGRRRVDAEWNYETQFAPVRAWMNADCDSGSRSI